MPASDDDHAFDPTEASTQLSLPSPELQSEQLSEPAPKPDAAPEPESEPEPEPEPSAPLDADGTATQTAVTTAPSWPMWQRIAFRYALLHAVLYMAPRPLSNLLGTTSSLLAKLTQYETFDWQWLKLTAQWLYQNPVTWLANVDKGWQAATTWCSDHHLVPFEVIHQMTGSGDTGHAFSRLFLIVVASILLTVIWSLVDRRAIGYPRLGRWLHLSARWYLAFWMLTYGGIKLYAGQFPEPGISRLTNEIGDTSPMGMVWTFLGASKPYEVFGGLGELLGGLLFFHRRTALLGAIITIAVMTNVCALNWLYDVPVKLFSTHLLLFAVALLAPWAPRLWAMFISNRSSEPVEMHVTKLLWLRRLLLAFGWLWALATLFQMHLNNLQAMEARAQYTSKPELFGRWDVDKMSLDGVEVPLSDASRWQFFAIDQGNRAFYRTANNQRGSWSFAEDLAENTITLTTQQPVKNELVWQFTRGSKTIQTSDPEPKTRSDFSKKVDAERRTMTFRGEWQGKQLELETTEHVFLLHRGFHWIQEHPFNR